VIEAVRPGDAAQVLAFVERVFAESVDAAPDEREAIVGNIRSNFDRWLADPHNVLHLRFDDDKGELCGVVMVKDCWNLCILFVSPERQGQGVGRALVAAAVQACRGRSPKQAIRLIAWRDAVGFYQRLGFMPVADAPSTFAGPHMEYRL
jgi:GNAT superfamily N-acetyltransferase